MIRPALMLTLAALATAYAAFAQEGPVVFKKGDRIVFAGNSITDGGHYHADIWLYYMTRFPDRRIDIFNAGIGGDVAGQIDARFEEDIAVKKPTVIALTFGMNDTRYFEYNQPGAGEMARKAVETSKASYGKIEQKLQALPAVRKILMASSPFDETVKLPNNRFPGKNDAMQAVAAFQQQSARANGWTFVDFNRPMTGINQREQRKDSLFTICGRDRIHPDNDGHLIMAYIFLKAQGLAGKKVAAVQVDATSRKIVLTENCRLTNLKVEEQGLRFMYLAESLPYPIDTLKRGWGAERSAADALPLIPFMKEMNDENLRITGLASEEQYQLFIDGKLMGSWTGSEWEQGINLATIPFTPQYQQALAVLHLNEERWEIERRFRMYAFLQFNVLKPRGLLFNDNAAALDTLNRLAVNNPFIRGNLDTYNKARLAAVRQAWQSEMDMLISDIYRINRPQPHEILVRAKP